MDRNITVGVDGSAASRAAMRWSMARAASRGRDVTLVHVIDPHWLELPEHSRAEFDSAVADFMAGEVALARAMQPGVPVSGSSAVGEPISVLAATRTDLLAVGTHKTGYLRGRAFGSRGTQLATAPVDLAVIPESSTSSRSGIVVAVDDSESGRAALHFGVNEAEQTGNSLTLVRAWWNFGPEQPPSAKHDFEAHLCRAAEALVTEATESVRALNDGLKVFPRVVHRPHGQGVLEVAAGADLLVIGAPLQPGIPASIALDALVNIGGPTVILH
jgi:nucleotide-binding universal stress UspA family protein